MKNTVLMVLGIFLTAGIVVTASCGGDSNSSNNDTGECAVGTLNCPCVAGACNAGLACEAEICIAPSSDTVTDSDTGTGTESLNTGTDTDEGVATDTAPETPTNSEITMTNDGAGKICAEGFVVGPPDDNGWGDHYGAGVGLDLCKPDAEYSSSDKVPLGECHNDLSRLIGFRVTITGELPKELRINLEDNFSGTDDVKGDNGYIIAEKLDEPVDYLFEDAAVFYITNEEERPALNPALFTSLQFQVASHLNEVEEFSFCVENLEIIVADDSPDGGVNADGGVGPDGGAVDDTGTGIAQNPDIECTPDSLSIVPTKNNWVDQCTNLIGLQGHWYSYGDGN